MVVLNDNKKIEVLNKVLQSEEFLYKDKYEKLLAYLVECSIKGEIPKALSIAIDVFNKDAKDYRNAGSVRVYMHSLREKLEQYYKTEGKDDEYKIHIPKGKYEVRFIALNEPPKPASKPARQKISIWKVGEIVSIISLVIVGIIMIYVITHGTKNTVGQYRSSIWENFITDGTELLFSIGEEFVFDEYISHYDRVVHMQDSRLSTDNSLKEYMKKNPDNKIIGRASTAYFSEQSFYGALNILPYLVSSGINYNIVQSGELDLRAIIHNDILYVGGNSTLEDFRGLLKNSKLNLDVFPEFKINCDSSQFLPPAEYKMQKSTSSKKYDDYCLFLKIQGPRHNTIMLLTSYYSVGVRAATKYITTPSSLETFESLIKEQNGEMPQYFLAVFKVMGVGRFNCEIDLEYFEAIDNDQDIWN